MSESETRNWGEYVRGRLDATSGAVDEGVVLEWVQHAEAAFVAARADGASAAEADAQVRGLIDQWAAELTGVRRRRFDRLAVEPPTGTSRGWAGMGHDFCYGVKLLLRQPLFTLVATLLVAVGVGATTTLSSLTYAVLLKPLTWPDADRLVRLSEHRPGETHPIPRSITNGTYYAWSNAPHTIDAIAGYYQGNDAITVRGDTRHVRVVSATASLFSVIPAHPLAGRFFAQAEEPDGANYVIVLSETVADLLFATPAGAVGQDVGMDGHQYRVIGVADRRFAFPTSDVGAWIPIRIPPVVISTQSGEAESVSMFGGIARLKPGVTPEQAAAEATARTQLTPALGLVGMAVFGTKNKPIVSAVPYLTALIADVRPALYVLVAGVVLLFLVAIGNVAGMQLARTTTRRREVAIRSALGAAPSRLARQLMTENLAIGGLGGLAGWLLSMALHQLLPRLLPADFPRLDGFHADWRVFAFALGSAVAASVVFGAAPALLARRLNLVQTLVEDGQAPTGPGVRTKVGRLRVAILAGQVAIAALLLAGASLFGRSFMALLDVDRGYEPHHLATVTLSMPDYQFTGARRAEVLDRITDRLAHTPGIASAAASSLMPLVSGELMMGFNIPPGPGHPQPTVARAEGYFVSPDYFTTIGMKVVRGRGFSPSDSPASQPVVVVNETFVRRYLPAAPLGATVPFNYIEKDKPEETVIGVVDDVYQHAVTDPPQPEIYFDWRQWSVGIEATTPVVLARTVGDPSLMLPTIARIISETEPGLTPETSLSMDERVMTSLAQPRLYALLLGAFAVFALLVSGTGLFGVLSYSVAQRSRELGVRAALGARRMDIAGLVVRQALLVTTVGTGLGLVAAYLLVRLVGALLYGVSVHDVTTFALVPVAILIIAALACFGPARRAAAIDPLTLLRG